jgi:hypothetical protein
VSKSSSKLKSLKTLRGLPADYSKEFVVGEPTQAEGYEFNFVIGLGSQKNLKNYEKAFKIEAYIEQF